MIIAVIGMSMVKIPVVTTNVHIVEVQDTVIIVAQDFANEIITLKNEMVAYFPTTITSLSEYCTPETLNDEKAFVSDYATNYNKNVLNWDCPIRGSPIT